MATVRKRERRMTLMSGKVKATKREGQGQVIQGQVIPDSNSVITLSPSPFTMSPLATPSIRG